MEIKHEHRKKVLAKTSVSKSSSMDIGTPSEKSINSDERRKAEGSRDHSLDSMEVTNEVCFGMHSYDYVGGRVGVECRNIEAELVGGTPKKLVDNPKILQPDNINSLSGENTDCSPSSPKDCGLGWTKVIEEVTSVGVEMTSLSCMGFSKNDLDPSNDEAVDPDVEMVHETISAGNIGSWAKAVNSLNNPKIKGLDEVAADEAESDSVDLTIKGV
ncbi:hypothetical protein V6N12_010173 [Hibiscus sabdariffa]|uniref:Uncharacterized protein n=1 Tax=Hibiscus sabdariffa TaxID=183260 RepID=A0ABR2EF58_9ROSI